MAARCRCPVVVLTIAVLLWPLDVHARQEERRAPATPQAVFRTTTRLIVEAVTVKDRDGRPIEGLTADDFVVTENGRPQPLAFVQFQRLSSPADATGTLSASQDEQPGDRTLDRSRLAGGRLGGATYRDRRLLILYFDLTSMPIADRLRAFNGARRYIDRQMSASDAIAVMVFDGGPVRVRQDFTGNRTALLAAIDALITGGDANGDGIPDDPDEGSAFGQNGDEFNIFTADRQLAALQTAAQMTGTIDGQKALLYFGSGFRLSGADNRAQLRATINAAVRANVSVNPVDARGLVAMAPIGDATRASPGGQGMFSGTLADALLARLQRSQDAFFALARDTGGLPFLDHNDLALGIIKAAQALTSYYVLGYYSTHTPADGAFRRVHVSLRNGRPGQLAYREGYFGERPFSRLTGADKERQLEDALKLDNPVTDIRIAAELNYFRLNHAEYFVPVSVRIPGSDIGIPSGGGDVRTRLDLIGEVKDEHGITHRNVRDKVDLRLTGERAARLPATPIRYETGFTLLPGRYAIKLLARDATSGRIGTYEAPFEVPNLDREQDGVAISSVVLSGQFLEPGGAAAEVRQKGRNDSASPLVRDGRAIIPSVTRVFRRDSDLFVLLESYPPENRRDATLVTFVSLFRDGAKVFASAPIVSTAPDTARRAIVVQATIALRGLPPGRYDCQVSVLDPGREKATFWRAPIAIAR